MDQKLINCLVRHILLYNVLLVIKQILSQPTVLLIYLMQTNSD